MSGNFNAPALPNVEGTPSNIEAQSNGLAVLLHSWIAKREEILTGQQPAQTNSSQMVQGGSCNCQLANVMKEAAAYSLNSSTTGDKRRNYLTEMVQEIKPVECTCGRGTVAFNGAPTAFDHASALSLQNALASFYQNASATSHPNPSNNSN